MKLKRLVSAIVAVGMMFAMLPVSAVTAFAATEVGGLKIVEGGYPMVPEEPTGDTEANQTSATIDGVNVTRKYGTTIASGKLDYCYGSGWLCKIVRGQTNASAIEIYAGYSYAGSEIPITVDFANKGTVTGGSYNAFSNCGTVTGGYAKILTNLVNGEINGGTFKKLKSNAGTINAAVFEQKDNLTSPNEITANGCLINKMISTKAYTVGEPTVTISYPDSRQKVEKWFINGQEVNKTTFPDATFDYDGDYATLTFKMPAGKNVVITVEKIKTELKIKDSLPIDEKGQYSGGPSDGWTYNNGVETTEPSKSMKIEDWYTADLEGNTVRWSVTNNGVLKNGTIRGGVINNNTVENVTCTGDFTNNDEIISGVFSRYAKFGEQNPSVRWVTVNGGTVNGMTTAGVVGEQEVTITAPDGFKCWSVAGDTDFTLTEEQKHTNPLTLKLNGEDKGTIILTAQSEEGYYPLNLTDGKAYSVTANGAKDKEITAARAGDTVILEADSTLIPDGMVFDRWEITGNTELTGGFDASAEKTQFTMPNTSVTIRAMYRMADVEEPNVLGTVAVVATAGVGAAILGWTGYNIAADLYAQSILPEGTAIPETKEALAVMLWQNAGKPEVAAADGASLTESEQAQQWVVANGLMENEEDGTFHPEKGVGKFAALNTIKKQTEKANAQ